MRSDSLPLWDLKIYFSQEIDAELYHYQVKRDSDDLKLKHVDLYSFRYLHLTQYPFSLMTYNLFPNLTSPDYPSRRAWSTGTAQKRSLSQT
jgi:hypothetical protein